MEKSIVKIMITRWNGISESMEGYTTVGLSQKMGLEKEKRKVPSSRIKILTKDAKQMVNGPYYCPKCRKELLQIFANVNKKEVYVVCKCGLEWQLTYAPVFQPIDYYNKFRDAWKKQSYGIIKQK